MFPLGQTPVYYELQYYSAEKAAAEPPNPGRRQPRHLEGRGLSGGIYPNPQVKFKIRTFSETLTSLCVEHAGFRLHSGGAK